MSERSGELKRAVTFDLSKPSHRALYDFSRTINFSEFVRRSLEVEWKRRQPPAKNSESVATVSLKVE